MEPIIHAVSDISWIDKAKLPHICHLRPQTSNAVTCRKNVSYIPEFSHTKDMNLLALERSSTSKGCP